LCDPAAVKSSLDSQTRHAACINREIISAAASYETAEKQHAARMLDALTWFA